ncbi:RNA polymerase sigma factor RpoD [subsurface metagenome]
MGLGMAWLALTMHAPEYARKYKDDILKVLKVADIDKELLDSLDEIFSEYCSVLEQRPYQGGKMINLREQIDEVLATLSKQEQRVIQLRFGLEDGRSRTLKEVVAFTGNDPSIYHLLSVADSLSLIASETHRAY